MHRQALVLIVCSLVLSANGFADEIYFKNGDRLSGQIVRLTDGKLVLKSAVAGEVTVNLAEVKTFSSEAPVEIHLKDGTVLHQPIAAGEPNEFALKTATPVKPQTFPLADVTAINPPPSVKPKWTGSISGALTSTTGNTKANSAAVSASVARRTEQDRTTAGADLAKGRQKDRDTGESHTTEDWWRMRAQYDYFFTKKFFGFGNVRYETDEIARLDRRVVLGGGAGYQWIETERTNLSTNVGLASLYEKYDNIPESNSDLAVQAGYNFSQRLAKNTTFLNDLTYFPSIEEFSDYFLTSTAELRTNLTKAMFANLKIIFNYDASPAPGRSGTDMKYLLGFGINF
ncbi:MAG: DUF481 domain-containing protein [Planctomycetes bacterium]|jgi:putative salt-induced outer membrane protein YdiY|nr:DUF481 domain-containing protein [Planctomycetota bacterium]